MLPIAASSLSQRKPLLYSNSVFCNIHGFLWNITSRLSIFLVMILSLTRTAFLTMPFKKMNKRAVLLSIVVYCVIQAFFFPCSRFICFFIQRIYLTARRCDFINLKASLYSSATCKFQGNGFDFSLILNSIICNWYKGFCMVEAFSRNIFQLNIDL